MTTQPTVTLPLTAPEPVAVGQPQPNYVGTAVAPVTYAVDNGQPLLGGVPVTELVSRFGTPLYVLDGETIRRAARAYRNTLQAHYPQDTLVAYACKANLTVGLARLMAQEGLGLDVVSEGELQTAIRAEVPGENLIFNGNNKSQSELSQALEYGVGRIVVDNLAELERLASVARQRRCKAAILLRVTPGIECHTHDYIRTGQNNSKFGFSLDGLPQVVTRILTEWPDALELKGLQAHIGSQIFELQAYEDLADIMLGLLDSVRQAHGVTLTDLDLGGGMGIAYTHQDDPQPIPELVTRMVTRLQHQAAQRQFPLPRLIVEPGRSLLARAGVTLYTVGARKDIAGYPPFVAVDGGMGDNIRPALYQAAYTAVTANRLAQPVEETVKLVGKYCESGDVLLPAYATPTLVPGDTVLVMGTGAYNYTMSSQYNRFPRPAMVLVENGQAGLLVRRETVDDLLRLDQMPEWLHPDNA